MTRPARDKWFRREGKHAEEPTSAGNPQDSGMSTERIAAYTPAPGTGTSSDVGGDGRYGGAAESEPLPNRSAGEEVDAILQSARATAAKFTAAATEEAEKIRADAEAYAARLRSEAEAAAEKLHAEAEHEASTLVGQAERTRSEAAKERADAEADAARLRSEAEAAAEKLHAEAEHEASKLVEVTRTTLVESALARVSALQAEAKRHEERLGQLLPVLRSMALGIEGLLERQSEDGHTVEPVDRDRAFEPAQSELGEVLQPSNRSEPVA